MFITLSSLSLKKNDIEQQGIIELTLNQITQIKPPL